MSGRDENKSKDASSPAVLRRRLDRLESFAANPNQAVDSVETVIDFVRLELTREYTAVASYTGKTAFSVDICETGIGLLATLAEDNPECVRSAVDILNKALTTNRPTVIRKEAATTLVRLSEADSKVGLERYRALSRRCQILLGKSDII